MEILGDFKSEMTSQYGNYDYRRWSIIKIDCVQYSTFCKIIEAITPILDDERKQMEEHYKDKE